MIDLSGKVAVITGGTRGIGAAIVEMCAGLGAQVVFTGRDDAAGAALREQLVGTGEVRQHAQGQRRDLSRPGGG